MYRQWASTLSPDPCSTRGYPSGRISHLASLCRILEIRLHAPILDPIHPELKHQVRALDLHMQFEIQIIELNPLCRREPREERLRHGIEIRRQCADVDEILAEGIGRGVFIAADEVVLDDERLTRPEVARVVERDGCFGGEGCAL